MSTILIRNTLVFLLAVVVVLNAAAPIIFSQNSTAIDGFSPDRVAAERRWEEQFRAVPDPKSAREHLRRLTIEPHIAGTKEDYDTAVYVRDQLRSYGLAAELREYEVWLNYPNNPSTLELITTKRQRLSTHEAVVPGDPTSSNPKITPLFNGYSASGDVTVDRDFGSFEAFQKQLSEAAATIMGSGWAALSWEPLSQKLQVNQIYDHQSNFNIGSMPVMVIDGWEHAWYLQYKNVKAEFFKALWNIWNWDDIGARYASAKSISMPGAPKA